MELKPGDKIRHKHHPEWGIGTVVSLGGRTHFWATWENHEQQVWLPVAVAEKV